MPQTGGEQRQTSRLRVCGFSQRSPYIRGGIASRAILVASAMSTSRLGYESRNGVSSDESVGPELPRSQRDRSHDSAAVGVVGSFFVRRGRAEVRGSSNSAMSDCVFDEQYFC